jgi:hypothetical protein
MVAIVILEGNLTVKDFVVVFSFNLHNAVRLNAVESLYITCSKHLKKYNQEFSALPRFYYQNVLYFTVVRILLL